MNDLPLELIQSLYHKKENHAFRSLKTFEGVDFFLMTIWVLLEKQ